MAFLSIITNSSEVERRRTNWQAHCSEMKFRNRNSLSFGVNKEFKHMSYYWSRDRAVGIATGYELHRYGVGSR
jgi:hypothetical protein